LLLLFCPFVVVIEQDPGRCGPDRPMPPVTFGNDRDRVDADALGDPRLFFEPGLVDEPFG
jgi:hypothetical protein